MAASEEPLVDNLTDQSELGIGDKSLAPAETDSTSEKTEDKPEAKGDDKEKKDEKPEIKKPFMLTFKDKAAAEKGFKEEQAKITKIGQDNAKLRGKMEVLEKLQSDADTDTVDPELQKKRDEDIIAELESGGSTAILRVIREGLLDVADLNKRQIVALKQEITSEMDQRDPELKANSDRVKELQEEYGLTPQNALKLAVKMTADEKEKKKESEELARSEIPGHTTSTQSGDGIMSAPTQLPPGCESFLDDCGLSEDVIEGIRKGLIKDFAPKE